MTCWVGVSRVIVMWHACHRVDTSAMRWRFLADSQSWQEGGKKKWVGGFHRPSSFGRGCKWILWTRNSYLIHGVQYCEWDSKMQTRYISRIHLVSLGFTWFHFAPLGFTCRHSVSLGCTWLQPSALALLGVLQPSATACQSVLRQQYSQHLEKFHCPTHLGLPTKLTIGPPALPPWHQP
jgi:hypothetical protein